MKTMNTRTLPRAIPALVVIALLCVAAAAPKRAGPAPPAQLQGPCTDFASAVAGDSSFVLLQNAAIEQAFPEGMSMAACSLRTTTPGYWVAAKIEVREWDPTTLAPSADAIALRTGFVNMSSYMLTNQAVPNIRFFPPVVTASVPGVADPPRPQVAVQVFNQFWGQPSLSAFFTPDGPPELPAAVRINPDSTREPLPGPHPVAAHALCAGDTDLVALRIVQSVNHANVKPFPAPKEFMQRFRVPQKTELRWIELALADFFVPYFVRVGDEQSNFFFQGFPVVEVIDGSDMPEPVPVAPEPLVQAPFQTFSINLWSSTLDFDRTVTLEPDHDYWIYVRKAAQFTFFNHRMLGNEPAAFEAGIGPYFARADTAGAWVRAADQILAFHVVGKPIAPVVSPEPPPAPGPPVSATFALNATPNPAQGQVHVNWSGAVGPVRFEVLDARGRRVSEGTGGAAGSWVWPGTDRDGRAVASGIYFVRARDSAGQLGNQRVMIIR